jgi:hypothetical protein
MDASVGAAGTPPPPPCVSPEARVVEVAARGFAVVPGADVVGTVVVVGAEVVVGAIDVVVVVAAAAFADVCGELLLPHAATVSSTEGKMARMSRRARIRIPLA